MSIAAWQNGIQAPDDLIWPHNVTAGENVHPAGATLSTALVGKLRFVAVRAGEITVHDDTGDRLAAAATMFFLPDTYTGSYTFSKSSETRYTWVHVTPPIPAWLDDRLDALPWPLPLSARMSELFDELASWRLSALPTRTSIARAVAVQLVWRYIGEGENRDEATRRGTIVREAERFIHDELRRPITLAEVARAAAVSPAHLTRLFRAELGTTPLAFVWDQRVRVGVQLLEESDLAVGTIAARCGFRTAFHFSRRVKLATGRSPIEIRRAATRKM